VNQSRGLDSVKMLSMRNVEMMKRGRRRRRNCAECLTVMSAH